MIVNTRKEWLRWLYGQFAWKHERKCWRQQPPKTFPCYCITILPSFGYEEEQPFYIYREDVAAMFPELENSFPGTGTR